MKNPIAILLLTASLALFSCENKEPADLIVKNARIYTVDSSLRVTEAFAVRDGRFAAVGSLEGITRKYSSRNIVDCGGRTVYPGFYDAHCHFAGYSDNLRRADLRGTKSFEEVCTRLAAHQEANPTSWILGRGWDQNDWPEKKYPDRSVLDQHFPDKPVYLIRIDGHAAMVNSVALKMAGINEKTKVAGGEIVRENGRVTGVLIDNAMDIVSSLIPPATKNERIRSLNQAQENCFAVGLTTVADAGLGNSMVRLMDSLQKAGTLKMRIYAMLSPDPDNFRDYVDKGIYKTDRLNIRSVKLYADGALGSRGALMLEPYSDDPGKTGLQVSETDYLRNICQRCYDAGFQVETHCIGDAANRLMLNIYRDILKGPNDRRWRIEHAQIIHPDDFKLFGDYDIVPSIQATHATSDMYWAADRVGPERVKGAYAFRHLMEQNGWIPNGSDFPVEEINPLYGFFAAFARMDHSGHPPGGWQMENALTREDGLKAMTIWAAKSCFEDHERGSIEPGKMADFVVLEDDIMTADPLSIPNIKVLQTWIGGEKVYGLTIDD
jgi:hypothetical protein